jgi:hypothetical protein
MKKMNMGGMADHLQKEHSIPKGAKAPGYKKGGPTSMDRKTMGRNMSRANNQRGR